MTPASMPCTTNAIPGPLVDHVASLKRPPPLSKDDSFYNIPNTPICQRAEAFIRDWIPDWAANHSFRTYAFALAIANYCGWDTGDEAKQLGFDKELIFLACVLHEMGMDAKHGLKSKLSLELWGGIKAREWILQQSTEFVEGEGRSMEQLADWADEACEAIARHTIEFRGFSSRVRLTGALVTLGAGQDIMGLSTPCIHPEDIQQICRRWPRMGYCEALYELSKNEVAMKPACLFEDCIPSFYPAMFKVDCFQGVQGQYIMDIEWQKRRDKISFI